MSPFFSSAWSLTPTLLASGFMTGPFYHYGPSTPVSELAGEVWLLLIKLSGQIKRCDEVIPRMRNEADEEMVEELVDTGGRLVNKFRKALKACEKPMLQTISVGKLGEQTGVEFGKTMIDEENEWKKTERWMHSIRLWNLRFDANCEEMIRNLLAVKAPT
ncbi:hypothetical protein QBC36DRAFT_288737 [Triangularia setosa]|uniref:Uncharacterized protein n=1 Tax=Triangularia setosa TaxID=2587417 RepID=A0AAN7AAB6_9PEZI|nr:hypothetical protein QBC36DRAFT_288737 [Podospora setosa]